MMQLQGSFVPDPFGLLRSFPPFQIINSIVNSYEKELKNIDPKELDDNLIVNTGLNIIGR